VVAAVLWKTNDILLLLAEVWNRSFHLQKQLEHIPKFKQHHP